jgi:hypothetical protein
MLMRDAEAPFPRPRRITAAPQRVNWWLRLTSSGWDKPQYTIAQRELARRSRLASWLILGLYLALVVVSPLVTGDTQTLVAFSLFAVGLTVCAALNRRGLVDATGALLVALIILVIMGPTVTSPLGLTMGQLPNYDALVIAVLVAATLLPRWAIFAVAALNSAIVVADFTLRQHHPNVQQDAALYASPALQTISLLVRPIALELIVAVVAYLWIRGTDEAIQRADRAEEIAQLEQREAERARDLTEGVRQLLAVHVRLANGDFRARAPLLRSPQLAQIAQSLNNLINRLARFAQAEAVLQRTHVEATRLVDALVRARQGQPFTIPPSIGTPLDPVVETLRQQAQRSGRMSQPRSDAQQPSTSPFSHPLSNPFPPSQYSAPASQPLSEQRPQPDPSLPEWLRPPESGELETPDEQ